jgi:hypothetical protein
MEVNNTYFTVVNIFIKNSYTIRIKKANRRVNDCQGAEMACFRMSCDAVTLPMILHQNMYRADAMSCDKVTMLHVIT